MVTTRVLPPVVIPPATNPACGVSGVTELLALLDEETPLVLTVATVNVYEVPLASPVTTRGLEAPVALIPLGVDVALYVTVPLPL
jgi:hypothetical protein